MFHVKHFDMQENIISRFSTNYPQAVSPYWRRRRSSTNAGGPSWRVRNDKPIVRRRSSGHLLKSGRSGSVMISRASDFIKPTAASAVFIGGPKARATSKSKLCEKDLTAKRASCTKTSTRSSIPRTTVAQSKKSPQRVRLSNRVHDVPSQRHARTRPGRPAPVPKSRQKDPPASPKHLPNPSACSISFSGVVERPIRPSF